MRTIKIISDNYINQIKRKRDASRGIVIDSNKILLSYAKKEDLYMIPGGGNENKESFSNTALREFKEETGYICSNPIEYLIIEEYFSDMLHINHYFILTKEELSNNNLTEAEVACGMESRWVNINDAIKIFSSYKDYENISPERCGLYKRELTALMEYLSYIKRINTKELLEEYKPISIQEEADKKYMLYMYDILGDKLFYRDSLSTHFSASCWITNKDHTKVLMNWHNIYKNWGWLGGHNDGDKDFLGVALKEAHEESGLCDIKVLKDTPVSIEILPVTYHIKNSKFVSSHTHMNLTYLFEADEKEELKIKPDENSGLKWVDLDEAILITNEEDMKPIYQKLNEALRKLEKPAR